jgi:hypothetical protein
MAIIKPVNLKDVKYVYRGKSGHCMCGCRGIYRYPSNLDRAAAEAARGYSIEDSEISDRIVNHILNIINANLETAEIDPGKYIKVDLGGRIFFVFFD